VQGKQAGSETGETRKNNAQPDVRAQKRPNW